MSILFPAIIVATIGLIAGIILTIASSVMKVSEDERVTLLKEALPGANCGACGYAGCEDYANALAGDGNISPSLCPVGGADLIKNISEILGVDAEVAETPVATVRCRGYSTSIRRFMKIDADWSCRAINHLYGGQMQCRFGCIGQGDCATVCPADAIDIVDGLAIINKDLCVGCKACETACPKKLIEIHDRKRKVYVTCQSHDKGMFTMKACEMGCISCGKCVRTCKFDAIKIQDHLAVIDYDKCTYCGMCAKVCETEAITNLRKK